MIGKQVHAKGCSGTFKGGGRNCGWLRKERGEEERGKSSVYRFWLREEGRRSEQIKPLPPQRWTLINPTTLPTIPAAPVIMLATNPLKRMIWNFTGGPDLIRSASRCMSATVGPMECANIYEITSHTPGPEVEGLSQRSRRHGQLYQQHSVHLCLLLRWKRHQPAAHVWSGWLYVTVNTLLTGCCQWICLQPVTVCVPSRCGRRGARHKTEHFLCFLLSF